MTIYIMTITNNIEGLASLEVYKDYKSAHEAMNDAVKLDLDFIREPEGDFIGESFIDNLNRDLVHMYDSRTLTDSFYEVTEREI